MFRRAPTGSPSDSHSHIIGIFRVRRAPTRPLRNQHSKGWSDTYWRFGTRDPEVDRLIEESEEALDFEENVRLVKEAQRRAMEVWTPSVQLLTAYANQILQSRVQHYEITQVSPAYHLGLG